MFDFKTLTAKIVNVGILKKYFPNKYVQKNWALASPASGNKKTCEAFSTL